MVKWAVEQWEKGNQVYFFGCGDYKEATSPSERVRVYGANLHTPTYVDLNKLYIAKCDDFIARLKPMRGNIWLMLTGHHMAPIEVSKTQGCIPSDQYIAEQLDSRYSGDGLATIYVTVNGIPFPIMAHHGYGSARTSSAQLNKRLEMRKTVFDARWYVMGHDNIKAVLEQQPFHMTPEGPRAYKQYFTGIGCLQESYEIGEKTASFAEKLLFPPSAIGFVRMTITLEKKDNKWGLDFHVRV